MTPMWPGDHMGMMAVWWLFGLAALVLLVWVVVRAAGSAGIGRGEEESPETILKRRYARGEVDREEYERRLNDLRK